MRQSLSLSLLLAIITCAPGVVSKVEAGGERAGNGGTTSDGASLSAAHNPPLLQSSNTDALQKQALEIEQLQLKNEKMRRESSWLNQPWVVPLSAFMGALIATGGAWWVARKSRLGTFDQAVLEKRLEKYEEIVAATKPLALYFPETMLTKLLCKEAGERLRASYFSGIGIYLSEEARDRYFRLVEALTRAAAADVIDVPATEDYPHWVNESRIDEYRELLNLSLTPVSKGLIAAWRFGQTTERGREILYRVLRSEPVADEDLAPHSEIASATHSQTAAAAHLFRDFVLLQLVSSRLRTALAADLGGRHRPG
jgi:hypothetical protein